MVVSIDELLNRSAKAGKQITVWRKQQPNTGNTTLPKTGGGIPIPAITKRHPAKSGNNETGK